MNEVTRAIWEGLAGASLLDRVNLVLGIAGVVLMVRRSLWAFPVGLVAVTVQGILFSGAKFYADAALQVFFFGALAWGWWNWRRAAAAGPELPVTRLTKRGLALTLAAAAGATVVWALALQRWTDAAMPWRDAGIAAFSVAAQVLQARKNLENWPFWIGVNAVAVASYWTAALAFTALLYAVYLGLAVAGWRAWRRAARATP